MKTNNFQTTEMKSQRIQRNCVRRNLGVRVAENTQVAQVESVTLTSKSIGFYICPRNVLKMK